MSWGDFTFHNFLKLNLKIVYQTEDRQKTELATHFHFQFGKGRRLNFV